MSETWYLVRRSFYGKDRIVPVDVERFTELSVFLKAGRCIRREGQYDNYLPSWAYAKAFVVKEAEQNVENAKIALVRAQGALDVARKLTQSQSKGGE
jgi:hypothetical protein